MLSMESASKATLRVRPGQGIPHRGHDERFSGGQVSPFRTPHVSPTALVLLGEEKPGPSHPENGANTGRQRAGGRVTVSGPLNQAKPAFILHICCRRPYTPLPLSLRLASLRWVVCYLKSRFSEGYRDAAKLPRVENKRLPH